MNFQYSGSLNFIGFGIFDFYSLRNSVVLCVTPRNSPLVANRVLTNNKICT